MAFDGDSLPRTVTQQRVVAVRHWTKSLFSFRLNRPRSFRFRAGEFVMLGLMDGDRPLLRAYSVASPTWHSELEFYSIKVPDGPLTSRLQAIEPNDPVLLGRKPTGTLVTDALKPGKRLFLLSTGTGIAPFASVVREPETYEKFEIIVLTHTCRYVADLDYGANLIRLLKDDPLIGDLAVDAVTYYPSVTRESFVRRGRITHLIESGRFFEELEIADFDGRQDRVMICGSMAMIADTRALLEKAGLSEGSNAAPGDYVVEKAFAE